MKISAQVRTDAFRDVAKRLRALEAAARDVLVPEVREVFRPEARDVFMPRPADGDAREEHGGTR